MNEKGQPSQEKSKSYFFMLIPHSLRIVKQAEEEEKLMRMRFLIYKGLQIFNQTKEPIDMKFNSEGVAQLEKTQLTFFLKSFNPNRKNDFILKIRSGTTEGSEQEQIQIGSSTISTNKFIQDYEGRGLNSASDKSQIGLFEMSYEIFIDPDRHNLEKIVKQFRQLQKEEFEMKQKLVKKQSFESENLRGTRMSIKISKTWKDEDQDKHKDRSNPEFQILEYDVISPKSPISPMGFKANVKKIGEKLQHLKGTPGRLKQSAYSLSTTMKNPINIKMIIFLFLSIIAIYYAMMPARRAPYKRYRR